MRKDLLIMFCRVIEEGSISQAARSSYISQPAVTSQIRQLEKHYGAVLFDRTSGKMVPTEAGSALYPYAKEIIDYYKQSEEAVRFIANQDADILNIGASLTIGEYLLPDVLGDLQKSYENLKVKLTIGNTPSIMSSLERRDIDIALVEGIVTHNDFHVSKFSQDELILVVSQHHRWCDRDEIKLEELVEEKMIWRERNAGIRNIVENTLEEHHLLDKVESYMELGSTQSIKSAVEVNLGISILPKIALTKELEQGIIKQVMIADIRIKRDLWLMEIKSRFPKKSISSFIDHLKMYMK